MISDHGFRRAQVQVLHNQPGQIFCISYETLSSKTIPFLTLAGQQTDPTWLDHNQSAFEEHVREPFIALAEHLKQSLHPVAPDYHFPTKGIGRIKRMANKVMPGDPYYKDWLSLSASKPSDSRFERNPHLFFGILPNEEPWKGIIVAGGLFMPSGPQLKKMRAAIADDSTPIHDLFNDRAFKARFKEGFSRFNVTTRVPRGCASDHPDTEWLMLKSFLVVRRVSASEFVSPKLPDAIVNDYKQLLRLNRIIEMILARA